MESNEFNHLKSIIDGNEAKLHAEIASIEKLFRERVTAADKAVSAALASTEKAIAVAQANNDAWKANANEWRSTLSDRNAQFASFEQMENLKERLDRSEGSDKGRSQFIAWGISVIMMIVALTTVGLSIFRTIPTDETKAISAKIDLLIKQSEIHKS